MIDTAITDNGTMRYVAFIEWDVGFLGSWQGEEVAHIVTHLVDPLS